MVRKKSLHIFLTIISLLELLVDQVNIVGAYFKSLPTDNNLSIFMKLP